MSLIQNRPIEVRVNRFNKTEVCVQSTVSINNREICRAYEAVDRSIPDGEYLAYVYKGKNIEQSHVRILSKEHKNAKFVLGMPPYLMAYHFCPCEEFTPVGGKFCLWSFQKLLAALKLGDMCKVVITSAYKV